MADISHSCKVTGNKEYAHTKMDKLMCDLLRSLGYGDGIDIFENTKK